MGGLVGVYFADLEIGMTAKTYVKLDNRSPLSIATLLSFSQFKFRQLNYNKSTIECIKTVERPTHPILTVKIQQHLQLYGQMLVLEHVMLYCPRIIFRLGLWS